ncbi:MAG: ATP-binding protein [Kiritimatiellaeota bacterium]|nr:ATP-binding protein [Kiritimatiellota bacterium]
MNKRRTSRPLGRRRRARAWWLAGLLGCALHASGAVLWRGPGPWEAHDNGAGVDVLHGEVKPQGNTSSSTLFFKFSVEPLSDAITGQTKLYEAGLVLYERGQERLGVGKGLVAHAYSAFNATGRGLFLEPAAKSHGIGEFDLRAQPKDSNAGLLEVPLRGIVRTILFKVHYAPGDDALVTVWFQPDLTPGNTEFSQWPGQITQFKAKAAFDELHFCHRGGGEGWRFSDLAVATAFEDFVAPHVWQQGWVVGLAALLGLGGLGGSLWLLERRQVRRRVLKLERARDLDQERARIARDLHDDLGVRLAEISLLANQDHGRADNREHLAQALRKIAGIAHETAQMADGIVWAVNPRNDTLHHLANYLVQFAENFFRPTPIRCRLDVPVQLPPYRLSSELRHHLLLAVKEACHNAARHSGATELWLRLNLAEATLVISIEDNGRGFDPQTVAEGGDGLLNMRTRMTSVGGRVELAAAPGQGMRIQLVVPLPPEE